MFNLKIIFLVIVLLVVADKVITVANINAVKKNYPKINPIGIEKNKVAKWFFIHYGLLWGSVIYGIISIITFIIGVLFAGWMFSLFSVGNPYVKALYGGFLIYGLV